MNSERIWDFWADKYERLWVQKYSLKPSRKAIIKDLKEFMNQGYSYRILDMGCGTGQLLREMQIEFSKYNISLRGVDASKEMIRVAEEKSKDIQYTCCSVTDFPEENHRFEIILCSHSFPYYEDKGHTIDKFYKLLTKNGILIMIQASNNTIYDSIALSFVKLTTSKAQYLSGKKMVDLLRKNFQNVEVRTIKERFYMPTISVFKAVKGVGK